MIQAFPFCFSSHRGVGVDFSPKMIELARERHPEFESRVADAAEFSAQEQFDYILLSDLVNDLPDVQEAFERLRAAAHPRTRLVVVGVVVAVSGLGAAIWYDAHAHARAGAEANARRGAGGGSPMVFW